MSNVILTHPRGAQADRCYMVSQIGRLWMRVWRGGDLLEAQRVRNEWSKLDYSIHPGEPPRFIRCAPHPHPKLMTINEKAEA
jgi:hypothetical protein